jgi:hypothetical protein
MGHYGIRPEVSFFFVNIVGLAFVYYYLGLCLVLVLEFELVLVLNLNLVLELDWVLVLVLVLSKLWITIYNDQSDELLLVIFFINLKFCSLSCRWIL